MLKTFVSSKPKVKNQDFLSLVLKPISASALVYGDAIKICGKALNKASQSFLDAPFLGTRALSDMVIVFWPQLPHLVPALVTVKQYGQK